MKVARFVLKIVAAALTVAAAVCCIIAYWDKIVDCFFQLRAKVQEKKKVCCCKKPAEFDDYADWELEA